MQVHLLQGDGLTGEEDLSVIIVRLGFTYVLLRVWDLWRFVAGKGSYCESFHTVFVWLNNFVDNSIHEELFSSKIVVLYTIVNSTV